MWFNVINIIINHYHIYVQVKKKNHVWRGLYLRQKQIRRHSPNCAHYCKLKYATDVFFHKKLNSVSSFCRGASKVISNDSPFNFGRRTLTQYIIKEVINIFHTYQIGCAFGGDITCIILLLTEFLRCYKRSRLIVYPIASRPP